MSDALDKLEAAIREFRGSADFDFVDPKRFAAVVDGLQGDLCNLVYRAKQRGEHLLAGQTPCGWTAQTCGLTPNAASDRLCVGKHLEAMPRVAEALSTGEGGSALKTAIESLSKRIGTGDERTPKQRRADALVEVAHHAMNQGTLPRRNGVRPHVTVHTTVEGLKRELGAAASELQNGMPISSKTVQRLACDGALARVLKAD